MKIYIIDDDKHVRISLAEFLSRGGHDVRAFEEGESALDAIDEDQPDVIFLDHMMPGLTGLEVLGILNEKLQEIKVIMITGYADVQTSVEAMKLGAIDYIRKPFNLEAIRLLMLKLQERKQQSDHRERILQELRIVSDGILGDSDGIRGVRQRINAIADSANTYVLLTGETGTGKNRVAHEIHNNSGRARYPFVEMNCHSVPVKTLQEDLFGTNNSSSSRTNEEKKGLIAAAQRGTIFIDSIDEMPIPVQRILLRLIETGAVPFTGRIPDKPVDVRIISAAKTDLARLITNNRFLPELYHYLSTTTMYLPPLRERGEDVLILADHFLNSFCVDFNRSIHHISEKGKKKLLKHHWPGNVRELRNVIERAVLFEESRKLRAENISIFPSFAPSDPDVDQETEDPIILHFPATGISLKAVEKELIRKALRAAGGNKTKAARLLDISRDKLRYKIKNLDLDNS